MQKWILSLLLATGSLMADYTAQPIDQKLLDSKIKIIDIRTPSEWKTTGIVKGSIPIMFFNEQGNYDIDAFLNELNKKVKKGERFALICASGSRTQILGNHLGSKLGYNVINLQGGIQYAITKKIPIEPYKP
jgi:rhodanese-related sulfurtransferase